MDLIIGFVEDNREIIQKVNRQAIWMAIGIVIVSYLIYWLVSLVIGIISTTYNWIIELFS
ncbi:MAG: hypothetical protein JEZ08_25295 [Clostridiales bacterium]|nr:hypothetical protein [Clostridiales bacterium]